MGTGPKAMVPSITKLIPTEWNRHSEPGFLKILAEQRLESYQPVDEDDATQKLLSVVIQELPGDVSLWFGTKDRLGECEESTAFTTCAVSTSV